MDVKPPKRKISKPIFWPVELDTFLILRFGECMPVGTEVRCFLL